MRRDTLNVICCPRCKGKLTFGGAPTDQWIEKGVLYCEGCSSDYKIRGGIPRFVSEVEVGAMSRTLEWLYNILAPIYDLIVKGFFAQFGGEERARLEYLERLSLKEGDRVLEVSVGTGSNLPYLVQRIGSGRVYGLDISINQLRLCRRKIERWGYEVELVQGAAEELPFLDNSFDIVFHMGGINFFSNKRKALNEMLRVARPGCPITIVNETVSPEQAQKLHHKIFLKLVPWLMDNMDPPLEHVPLERENICLDYIWRGHGYLVEFNKPYE